MQSVPITTVVVSLNPVHVLDTTLCDKVCQWLATGGWFSPCTPISSTNKTDRHDIAELLFKVVLNTNISPFYSKLFSKVVTILNFQPAS
jgi:hypothetical protein